MSVDVTQPEDSSRIRTTPLPQIFAIARNFTLNLCSQLLFYTSHIVFNTRMSSLVYSRTALMNTDKKAAIDKGSALGGFTNSHAPAHVKKVNTLFAP